jgi:selenocysteine-specific elongation factor
MTIVVGTAGHIDHGKTTLLRALTGIDADRLPEERRRGMTIDVGYAHFALADGTELDFVDVPGHDRLVGNMLVGAGEIDAAMLVVAADDGPRAQTLEHLALLDALGIAGGIAVVTKVDMAGTDRAAEVATAVARLLAGTSLGGSPVIVASSLDGRGIDDVKDALERLRDRLLGDTSADPRPSPPGPSRLAVDRVFAVKGRGAVVTGSLRGGPLTAGATLRVVPGDRSVRVRELQVHGRSVGVAGPGRTALNLAGVDASALRRGIVLTDDPAVVSSDRVLVALRRPLPDRTRARVHLGTAAVDGAVGRSGRDALDLRDGRAVAILRLAAPVAVAAGDALVLRRTAPRDPIVGAVVLDARPARGVSRRRQTIERVEPLAAAVAARDEDAIAAARLDLHGALVGADGTPRLAGDVDTVVAAAVLASIGAEPALAAARAVAARTIRRSVSLDRDAAVVAASTAIDRLIGEGRLERDGAVLRTPGTAPGGPPSDPELEHAMDRLERALAVAAPAGLGEAARAAGCPPDGIRALERAGRIVVLEPDLAYAAATYREIEATALALAGSAPLTPAALRDATGTSRKYVMAVLADLDRRGVLRRTPDGHLPGPRAPAVGSTSR